MLINIDGWFGGGKSVLWSLLDGHDDVFVCPVHDFSFSPLLKVSNDMEWLLKKNPVPLRKLLAESEYYKLEKIFLDGAFPVCYSVDTFEYRPYNTNFYEFDKCFFNRLEKAEYWTVDFIIKTLYQTYYQVYQQCNEESECPKFIATMSHPGYFKDYIKIPKILPNMKNILVKRGLENIISTRVNRNERPNDLNTFKAFRTPFSKIIESKEIEKITDYFCEYERLSHLFPNQFMVVDFDKLVRWPEQAMRKVAEFLDIRYTAILSKPTRDGKILEYQGLSFIGKENDDYRQLLSAHEIKKIDDVAQAHISGLANSNFDENLAFSVLLNRANGFISDIAATSKSVVIYGDSVFGRYVHSRLGNQASFIVDQKVMEDKPDSTIRHPAQISYQNIDLVIVAVLGREMQVMDYLVDELYVPRSKLMCLDLTG